MTNAQHEDIDIKYLNLVDESMDSQIDQCLYSKTDGPDSILVEDLPHWARHHASNGIEQLLRLPQKLIIKGIMKRSRLPSVQKLLLVEQKPKGVLYSCQE